ncbi:MAG: pilus assembly protein TadG-related protein [Erysipelotrichaceae bacterium]|nr:pilus assembly protein TadG-related protein [Erysipelotrichaceae bacterium]
MFKKFQAKLSKNEGSISLGCVLAMPVVLLILFLMIDLMHITGDKASLQRRVDSAVLGIAAKAAPEGNVLVDSNGIIVEGINAGNKVCEITPTLMNEGIEQIKKDAYDVGIELTGIVNLSDEDQMKSGVAKIQAKGYSENLLINALIPGGVKIPFVVESYASCSLKIVE